VLLEGQREMARSGGRRMTNREWLNSLSNEDFCTALEQIDCRLCAFYGDCKDKQCRDGFVEWLKKEHEDGKEG
jgi:hypothetical protein